MTNAQAQPIEAIRYGDPVTPNQSYLVKQLQLRIATALGAFIRDLGGPTLIGAQPNINYTQVVNGDGWRKGNQRINYTPWRLPGGEIPAYIYFANVRWSPDSKIVKGPEKIDANVLTTDDTKTKIIKNTSDVEVDVDYEEHASLTNAFSTSISKGMDMDLDVKSETKIGGSIFGVNAEETLTAEFNIKKTQQETKDQSEEGTKDQAIRISFKAKPGENYLVNITKEHETTEQSFDIHGVVDMDFSIVVSESWEQGKSPFHRALFPGSRTGHAGALNTPPIGFVGIDGLQQFVHGYDTNWPQMANYWAQASQYAKLGLGWVFDDANRTLHVTGTKHASLEDNADYVVKSLGSSIPDNLKGLPTVDANDLMGIAA